MKILFLFAVVVVASAKSKRPLAVRWTDAISKIFVGRGYEGEFKEFLADLGWTQEKRAEYEKDDTFCMELMYNNITIKWDVTFTLLNKTRTIRGIERGKEFEETLFDGRKAKSQVMYNPDGDDEWATFTNATWTSSIIGGPKVRHDFYFRDGYATKITSQVEGKKSRSYWMGLAATCYLPD